jgi:hypothetical protein
MLQKQSLTADKGKYKVIECRRELHNGELHNLRSSPSIVNVVKSRKMGWVGHVARMREARKMLVGKSQGCLGDLDVSVRI